MHCLTQSLEPFQMCFLKRRGFGRFVTFFR
jgi:hypothetical protein